MLLKPKLIIINIHVCNIIGHIPNLGNNFTISAILEKNVSVTYLTQTVLSLITLYQ